MRIYLDHAASTPMRPEAAAAMQPYLTDSALMANPSSPHTDGRRSREALEGIRARVAAHFACQPSEVIFNSGGSEGDNHAIFGCAWDLERELGRKPRIAISAIEHEAVVRASEQLVEWGCHLHLIPVTSDGAVPLEAAQRTLVDFAPDLVSVMAVNNEIGTVQPVGEIAQLCSERGIMFHSDGVRAVGHGLPQIQRDPRIPILNSTGHKFGGPRGAGLMVVRRSGGDAEAFQSSALDSGDFATGDGTRTVGATLSPLVLGGAQEHGLRAGTENLAGAAGLLAALDLATDAEAARLEGLRARLERELQLRWPDGVIHGASAQRATHITSVSFLGRSGPQLAAALDQRGIAVGAGSACHSAEGSAGSPTLRAMGVSPELAGGTLRISLGWSTADEHIAALLTALGEVL